jgi:hypothetical protein
MSNQPMPFTPRSPRPEGLSTLPAVKPPAPAEQHNPPPTPPDELSPTRATSDERKREEDRDEVLRESFPASDPPPMSPGAAD